MDKLICYNLNGVIAPNDEKEGELMKKKDPAGAGNKPIIVNRAINLSKKNEAIAVIDKKLQRKFPRLAVLSTQTLRISKKKGLQPIKDSEPKLLHDK